ncbi:MAG: hypothetical protein IPL78_27055 [Chloroflexi bacterium]|nr:hypothetical protein [Chloroflexota bacterium]
MRLWDTVAYTETGVLVGTHRPGTGVGYGGRGQCIGLGRDDNTIRLWDLGNVAAAATILEGHEGSVRALRLSTDEQTLYSAGMMV